MLQGQAASVLSYRTPPAGFWEEIVHSSFKLNSNTQPGQAVPKGLSDSLSVFNTSLVVVSLSWRFYERS